MKQCMACLRTESQFGECNSPICGLKDVPGIIAKANHDANGEGKQTNPKDAIGSSKLPLNLVPDTLTAEAAPAFLEGALKYGATNWRVAGVRASIYKAALQRHLAKWWNGQDRDPKTRVKHLASVIACATIILDAELCGKLTDDRPPAAPVDKLIDEGEDIVAHLKQLFKDHNPKHHTIKDTQ